MKVELDLCEGGVRNSELQVALDIERLELTLAGELGGYALGDCDVNRITRERGTSGWC